MNQVPLTVGGFPQPNPNMTVGGYPNPNMPQQSMYPQQQPMYPQQPQPMYQQQQPMYPQQPQVMMPQQPQYMYPQQPQVDPVRLQKLKDAKVPGISFKNLIASMGFQPISATTAPGGYNMQLGSLQQSIPQQTFVNPGMQMSQPPMQYGQPMMPYQTANPMVNLQAIHLHQLMQMQVNDRCQGCEKQLRNEIGFGCAQCKFYLCQSCYAVACQGNPNYGLHASHQLTPKSFAGWRCDSCSKRVLVTKKLSMRCGICDKDFCLECFFKRK